MARKESHWHQRNNYSERPSKTGGKSFLALPMYWYAVVLGFSQKETHTTARVLNVLQRKRLSSKSFFLCKNLLWVHQPWLSDWQMHLQDQKGWYLYCKFEKHRSTWEKLVLAAPATIAVENRDVLGQPVYHLCVRHICHVSIWTLSSHTTVRELTQWVWGIRCRLQSSGHELSLVCTHGKSGLLSTCTVRWGE